MRLMAEVDMRALDKAIKIAPRVLKFELGDGMDRISKGFLKRFRQQRLQGPPGVRGASGHGLFGTFKRVSLVSPTIEGMGMQVYSDSKIAKLHETGGIVKDPSGGRMAVPLSARSQMFTAKGKLRGKYKKPRQLKNVEPMRFKGQTFLVRVTKRAQKLLPLYVLKRSVRLKPRLGFYRVWDSLANYRIEILNKKIENALRKI
ncbi:hypothetical protein KKB41_04310 [Patescibacteria group bacterium]|nr:hypothetical protein [Patescibacteria group bacterium]